MLKKLGEPVTLPPGASSLLGRDTATSLALLDVVPDMPKPEALVLLNKARFDQAPVVRVRVGATVNVNGFGGYSLGTTDHYSFMINHQRRMSDHAAAYASPTISAQRTVPAIRKKG